MLLITLLEASVKQQTSLTVELLYYCYAAIIVECSKMPNVKHFFLKCEVDTTYHCSSRQPVIDSIYKEGCGYLLQLIGLLDDLSEMATYRSCVGLHIKLSLSVRQCVR